MRCDWNAYLNLLPHWMRQYVNSVGSHSLQELRLRLQLPPELVLQTDTIWMEEITGSDDLVYCINAASRYSPWSASTISNGFVTAPGGHRVGICGNAIVHQGHPTGISSPKSLCIRVARDFPGIARKAIPLPGSILIIGPPGSGKTTLLRDLIRGKSETESEYIAVIDERGEVFPTAADTFCFPCGRHTDVLSGYDKPHGIENAIRCMGPTIIAVDEITADADCTALIHAGWCGVKILATAHAKDVCDLMKRPVYKPLIRSGLFDYVLILQRDKSWKMERLGACTVK